MTTAGGAAGAAGGADGLFGASSLTGDLDDVHAAPTSSNSFSRRSEPELSFRSEWTFPWMLVE